MPEAVAALPRDARRRVPRASAPSSRACPPQARREAVGARARRGERRRRRDVVIGHLSKGYRQRVGLADALVGVAAAPHPRRADRRPRSEPDPRGARRSSASSARSTRCSSRRTSCARSRRPARARRDRARQARRRGHDRRDRAKRRAGGRPRRRSAATRAAAAAAHAVARRASDASRRSRRGARRRRSRASPSSSSDDADAGRATEERRRGARRRGHRRARGRRRRASLEEVFAELTARRDAPSRRAPESEARREELLADLQARALRALRDAARVGAHHRVPRSCRGCTSSCSSLTSRARPTSADGGPGAGVLRQDHPPLPAAALRLPAAHDAPLRRGAAERHDRVADHRARRDAGRRAREVRRRARRPTSAMWAPTVLYIVSSRAPATSTGASSARATSACSCVGAGYLALGTMTSAIRRASSSRRCSRRWR